MPIRRLILLIVVMATVLAACGGAPAPQSSGSATAARLPNTSGVDLPWLALALAAMGLLCVGCWLRRSRAGGA